MTRSKTKKFIYLTIDVVAKLCIFHNYNFHIKTTHDFVLTLAFSVFLSTFFYRDVDFDTFVVLHKKCSKFERTWPFKLYCYCCLKYDFDQECSYAFQYEHNLEAKYNEPGFAMQFWVSTSVLAFWSSLAF